jgi:pimeloyl-ACP methyl ester carboxylesterase
VSRVSRSAVAGPVVKSLPGKAAVPDDHPFTTGCIGVLGTRPSEEALEGADTLLLVGTSFPWAANVPDPAKVRAIQIETDPARLGGSGSGEVTLLGDAAETLGALLPARIAVTGRSYGGYMTLTLAARHPELWRGAVDMFGPYDLFTFIDRLPETWKPYFAMAVGDPAKDGDFLTERSPRTHIADISCPLLVIQGQNDPRVVERESRDLVVLEPGAAWTGTWALHWTPSS